MDNQLGLDFFCKYANVGTISANLFILLNIIIKLNRIDYIKRKIFFYSNYIIYFNNYFD